MDRWKSKGVKSPGGEDKKWEDQRRERVRRNKMQVREKVGKSRFTVFFQWFVAREDNKAGSLKRQVRSHLARWEMKNCTPLWCEAHLEVKKAKDTPRSDRFWEVKVSKKCAPLWREARFQVKSVKNWQSRTTFSSLAVEQGRAVVARSTFPSQNAQSTPGSDQLFDVQIWKKCMPLWCEAHWQVKSVKHRQVRTTLWRSDVEKKCTLTLSPCNWLN